MKFRAGTQIPIASLTFLSRLKHRYACGPILNFDDEQLALLDAYDALYPVEKLRAMHAAIKAGRGFVTGADVFAFAPKSAAVIEEPAEEVERQ
jgi:hypothetical protein